MSVMEDEESPGFVLRRVLLHLPPVPETTKAFILFDSASSDGHAGSLNSGGEIPASGVGSSSRSGHVTSDPSASSTGCALSHKSDSERTTSESLDLPDLAVALVFLRLPIKDIFRVGYLVSRKWFSIWQGIPLMIHDVQLAPDHLRGSIREGEITNLNSTKALSRVLDLHPGPIELFRADFSTWSGGSSLQWRVWFEKLTKKKAKQVILRGRWPRSELDVLPNNLVHCQTVEQLHLCFFSLPRITDHIEFPLRELQLSHCIFQASDLDSILRSCNKLTKLTLGYVTLDMLRIESDSLSSLVIWSSSIDILCLSGTPRLTSIFQESERTLGHQSHLQVRGIPNLWILHCLHLSQQTIEICGYLIKADMIDYPMCSSITSLGLVVDFSSPKEIELIACLLRCFPKLKRLTIFRLDSHESYAGPAIDWYAMLSSIQCIKTTLNSFRLCNCRGDDIEEHLATAISRCAAVLKKLQVEFHPLFYSGKG